MLIARRPTLEDTIIRFIAPVVMFLLIVPALSGCFGPGQDDDLLEKEDEIAGWDVTVTEADGSTRTYHVQSDWAKEDADQDELDDFQESALRLDPNQADTDGDGLLDAYNIDVDPDDDRYQVWADDGILFTDNDEGTRTFLGEWDHQSEPLMVDTDGDGLSDGAEVGGLEYDLCGEDRLTRTSPRQEDTDGDNLMDGDELFVHGSDPTQPDTDGDGATDLVDIDPCADVVLGYATFKLTVSNESLEGPFWVDIYWPNERLPVSVGPFDGEDQTTFDVTGQLDPEDVDDGQGNLRDGDRNLTAQVFAYAGEGDQRRSIDIGSTTGGTAQVIFAYDAATGNQYVLDSDQQPVSPADAETFEGTDGQITLRLERAD